ncbi:MAG: hypothetical protein RJA22_1010 [Verrucomicrobiota bacterium]
MTRRFRAALGLALLTGSAGPLAAQTAPAPPPLAPPTNAITPTVTAAQGDPGGTFFGTRPDPARVRRYYVAIEPELWDFAPQGQDPICGKPFPPPVVQQRRSGKLRYVEYTDESFGAKAIPTARLGILGPVLRGVVGDYLVVTLYNRTSRPLSMHPHGVRYDKDSEGSYYEPRPGRGAAVGPGAKFTYVWHLDAESGPLPDEPSSKAWLYHSHVNGDEEANLGLIGFIVVTDPARARPDGTPSDIEREHAALFMMFDESGLGEAEREAAEYAALGNGPPPKTWSEVQEILEQGSRAAINGMIFGNLPGLEMNEGERVRWYLFGLGSVEDFHTAHWHGLRVTEEGRRRTDVVELLPASMKVADMLADNPGSWLFHCHVAEHMQEGMFARVTVHPRTTNGPGRAAGPAFFGLRGAMESLRLQRAEVTLGAAQACTLRVEGSVTVFEAFSVFTQPVELQLGETKVSFRPDRRNQATVAGPAGGTWRVRNASQFGVVYGGMMEFEAVLTGSAWLEQLQRLNLTRGGPARFTLKVGDARHTGSIALQPR